MHREGSKGYVLNIPTRRENFQIHYFILSRTHQREREFSPSRRASVFCVLGNTALSRPPKSLEHSIYTQPGWLLLISDTNYAASTGENPLKNC